LVYPEFKQDDPNMIKTQSNVFIWLAASTNLKNTIVIGDQYPMSMLEQSVLKPPTSHETSFTLYLKMYPGTD